MTGGLLESIFIFLCFACLLVPLAKWVGLGSIIGYLLAGILIGPDGLGLISDPETVLHFSEFGVVLMLFLIGLEVQPKELWKLRGRLIGLGMSQVALSTLAISGAAVLAGMPVREAIVIGMALALSSTAIGMKIMEERSMIKSQAGQSVFSVLLFQDVIVILMIAVLPLLAISGGVSGAEHAAGHADSGGHGAKTGGLSGPMLFIAAIGSIGGMVIAGRLFLRPLLRFITRMRVREVLTAFALLMVVGSALLMQSLGLSAALGAFIAGVVLADSEYRHQLERDIDPFKSLLLGLFFMSVGMTINFAVVIGNPGQILAMLAGLIIIKFIILIVIAKIAKLDVLAGSVFAVILAQGGEFAFVLFQFALTENALPKETVTQLVAVVALSMAATPLLLLVYDKLAARKLNTDLKTETGPAPINEGHNIMVLGFGRVGQMAARLVETQDIGMTLIDYDSDHIAYTKRFGSRVFYGDAADMDLLRLAGAEQMSVIIVAVAETGKTVQIVKDIKENFPNAKIVARARDRSHMFELLKVGVDYVERESVRGALAMGAMTLQMLGMDKAKAKRLEAEFLRHDLNLIDETLSMSGDLEEFADYMKSARLQINRVMQADEERWHEENKAAKTVAENAKPGTATGQL